MTNEQKPSIGRTVHFAAADGPPRTGTTVYAAIITAVNPKNPDGSGAETVELATFGPSSLYFQHAVKFDADGAHGTWRWPPKV